MTCFLTSSPCLPNSPALNPANGFVDELQRALPGPCRALFIASDPDSLEYTGRFAADMPDSFSRIGRPFSAVEVLGRANQGRCGELVAQAELIFLCGGHVPTQNRFFQDIRLRERLQGWDGVVIGVSAGSMNAADPAYAPPEEPGEAADPGYRRWLPGLGLTRTTLFPHFQRARYDIIDGQRLLEDILCPDSMGRTIYAMVDGSYLLGRDGREELRGEVCRIENGVPTQLSREGEATAL